MEQALQEVQRLFELRKEDLADLQAQAQEREFLRGRREAHVDGRIDEHQLHLERINGSIDKFVTALESLEAQINNLEKAHATSDAVATALAAKAVSTKTFIYGVMTLLVPIIVLVVTLIVNQAP